MGGFEVRAFSVIATVLGWLCLLLLLLITLLVVFVNSTDGWEAIWDGLSPLEVGNFLSIMILLIPGLVLLFVGRHLKINAGKGSRLK